MPALNYQQSSINNENPSSKTVMPPTSNQSVVASNFNQSKLGINKSSDEKTSDNLVEHWVGQSSSNPHQTGQSSCPAKTLDNQSNVNCITDINTLDHITTTSVTTPQKQLLNILAQTPGQSSNESSPASKTAEMCISSFCNISSEGGTNLTIQNNSLVTHGTSQSDRSSVDLTSDLNHKLKYNERLGASEKERSRRGLEKEYASDKNNIGDRRSVCDGDKALPSSSAVRKETGKDTSRRQGLKRSGSADLKENKVI